MTATLPHNFTYNGTSTDDCFHYGYDQHSEQSGNLASPTASVRSPQKTLHQIFNKKVQQEHQQHPQQQQQPHEQKQPLRYQHNPYAAPCLTDTLPKVSDTFVDDFVTQGAGHLPWSWNPSLEGVVECIVSTARRSNDDGSDLIAVKEMAAVQLLTCRPGRPGVAGEVKRIASFTPTGNRHGTVADFNTACIGLAEPIKVQDPPPHANVSNTAFFGQWLGYANPNTITLILNALGISLDDIVAAMPIQPRRQEANHTPLNVQYAQHNQHFPKNSFAVFFKRAAFVDALEFIHQNIGVQIRDDGLYLGIDSRFIALSKDVDTRPQWVRQYKLPKNPVSITRTTNDRWF